MLMIFGGIVIDRMVAQRDGAGRSWRAASGSLHLRMAHVIGGRSGGYALGAHGIGAVLGAFRKG